MVGARLRGRERPHRFDRSGVRRRDTESNDRRRPLRRKWQDPRDAVLERPALALLGSVRESGLLGRRCRRRGPHAPACRSRRLGHATRRAPSAATRSGWSCSFNQAQPFPVVRLPWRRGALVLLAQRWRVSHAASESENRISFWARGNARLGWLLRRHSSTQLPWVAVGHGTEFGVPNLWASRASSMVLSERFGCRLRQPVYTAAFGRRGD